MTPLVALVRNADRMMTTARAVEEGIELAFADGCKGVVPFTDIPEIETSSNLEGLELPNPYEVVVRDHKGKTVELPWDFVRHFCDPQYRARVEPVAHRGRLALGKQVRGLREAAGLTQDTLASAAGIGRVTLIRIENGEQSPRYSTLIALARALGCEPGELLAGSALQE